MARPNPAAHAFAERLEIALRRKGVGTMYSLAVDLGVDESAISRWRRGRPISTDNLIKLSDHLDVSIDWLLTGRGGMAPPGDASGDWSRRFRQAVETVLPGGAAELATILRTIADACQEAS